MVDIGLHQLLPPGHRPEGNLFGSWPVPIPCRPIGANAFSSPNLVLSPLLLAAVGLRTGLEGFVHEGFPQHELVGSVLPGTPVFLCRKCEANWMQDEKWIVGEFNCSCVGISKLVCISGVWNVMQKVLTGIPFTPPSRRVILPRGASIQKSQRRLGVGCGPAPREEEPWAETQKPKLRMP